MEKIVEYTKGELTIVWRPGLCQHAGVCVKMLPLVYNPKERPWVKPDNATVEELIAQISNCPSGALSYRIDEK
ncbi:(4Fe-4S)-binding protein [Dysgonomonas sp. BGC7]|uniref:(4Fe-4S)-binding protein n=1 Tax=Dysgonomonas sp. BGC7 TaxID=1658008 RepID=UPI000680BAA8|nr:(4Fe-4S)-binding protein [Dysgonomonas sp. BGC7]MBD8388006.1 (4Fe-4S)-binding protein [Dysgonomonas sp. BGC7]